MSTPTSTVTIKSITNNKLVIRVRPNPIYNGFLNGYGFTRSYVLGLLGWYPTIINSNIEFKEFEIGKRISELAEHEGVEFWCIDEGFFSKHCDKFIIKTEIVNKGFEVTKIKDIDSIEYEITTIYENEELTELEKEDLIASKLNPLLLRVEFTNKEFIEGVEVGMVIETTSQDRWWNDPTNPY